MSRGSLARVSGRIVGHGPALVGLAGLGLLAAFWVPDSRLSAGLVSVASVLLSTFCLGWIGARVAAFLAAHPDWCQLTARRWEPGPSGDGFFLARLQRRDAEGGCGEN